METFPVTVEIGDPRGQQFEPVEMLVGTGVMLTRVPREVLKRLAVPEERTYSVKLADGRREQRTRGRTMIRLQGQEFPTPVTFGEAGEQSLLGDLTLADALLAVDLQSGRLIPVDGWLMTVGCVISRVKAAGAAATRSPMSADLG